MDDLIERAQREVIEDRRIAALACQRHTKNTLLQRAQVTEDLIAKVERLRSELHLCHGTISGLHSQIGQLESLLT